MLLTIVGGANSAVADLIAAKGRPTNGNSCHNYFFLYISYVPMYLCTCNLLFCLVLSSREAVLLAVDIARTNALFMTPLGEDPLGSPARSITYPSPLVSHKVGT
jgi:hypothetical protein